MRRYFLVIISIFLFSHYFIVAMYEGQDVVPLIVLGERAIVPPSIKNIGEFSDDALAYHILKTAGVRENDTNRDALISSVHIFRKDRKRDKFFVEITSHKDEAKDQAVEFVVNSISHINKVFRQENVCCLITSCACSVYSAVLSVLFLASNSF